MSNAIELLQPAGDSGFAPAQRDEHETMSVAVRWLHWMQARRPRRMHAHMPAALRRAIERSTYDLQALPPQALTVAALNLRARPAAIADRAATTQRPATELGHALALAGVAMRSASGMVPYDNQMLAAAQMLAGRFVEMDTGEGKTLAVALAAGAAALLGERVQVLTANDYLVERDAAALAPYYALLGLRCASVGASLPAAERPLAYRADVVYTTAREIAFDYLRDHLALGGERDIRMQRARRAAGAVPAATLVPALSFAIVDEADSLLLDEAVVPLRLAVPAAPLDPHAITRAAAIAATLETARDFSIDRAARAARLHDAGCEVVARVLAPSAVAAGGAPALPLRGWFDLVEAALTARHVLERERDYIVADGRVILIDAHTGRRATGRQWSGALQAMVEHAEGQPLSAPTEAAAQLSYLRLFPRWLRLAGTSGTLREAGVELHHHYGAPVVRVARTRAPQLRWHGTRVCRDAASRWALIAARAARLAAAGRPVLIGTADIGASRALAARLRAAGVPHQVLDAAQDAAEAAAVACAGDAGRVTVSTNMAGRGTDIRLTDAARAAGGLHVIVAMAQRSRRLDRQLIGRAARQGDPGSAECILTLDETAWTRRAPLLRLARWLDRAVAALAPTPPAPPRSLSRPPLLGPARWLVLLHAGLAQRLADAADRQRRTELARVDRLQADGLGFAGTAE